MARYQVSQLTQQRGYFRFVLAPTLQRASEQWFSDLKAGRLDRAAGSMERQTLIAPRQAAIFDQPPGLTFQIVHHFFVADVE